jgi:hypothetical protein
VSEGSAWGALEEAVGGKQLAPGASFFPVSRPETAMWEELAATGTFSDATVRGTRAPEAYATAGPWVAALEASAAKGGPRPRPQPASGPLIT